MGDNTIRGMLRQQSEGTIQVVCGHCGHHAIADVSCWDPDLKIPDLKRFFRCAECGEKAGRTMPTWDGWWAPGIGYDKPEWWRD